MSIETPSITGSGIDQIQQIKSYLFRLSEQLNYELNNLSEKTEYVITGKNGTQSSASAAGAETMTALATFNAIKSLIINSAEIVNAYYADTVNLLDASNKYVAQSDFGDYVEDTSLVLQANATGITQNMRNIRQINSHLLEEGQTLTVDGRIRSGVVDYDSDGNPIYGIEVGQTNTLNGAVYYNRFARFTSSELAFYGDADIKSVLYTNIQFSPFSVPCCGMVSEVDFDEDEDISAVTLSTGERFTIDYIPSSMDENSIKAGDFVEADLDAETVTVYRDYSTKVASINSNTMHITNAVIEKQLDLGKYQIDTSSGLVFNWRG